MTQSGLILIIFGIENPEKKTSCQKFIIFLKHGVFAVTL